MNAWQLTIAIVGLVISAMLVGAEGMRDYRDARMSGPGIPFLVLLAIVAIELYGRVWI